MALITPNLEKLEPTISILTGFLLSQTFYANALFPVETIWIDN